MRTFSYLECTPTDDPVRTASIAIQKYYSPLEHEGIISAEITSSGTAGKVLLWSRRRYVCAFVRGRMTFATSFRRPEPSRETGSTVSFYLASVYRGGDILIIWLKPPTDREKANRRNKRATDIYVEQYYNNICPLLECFLILWLPYVFSCNIII